MFNFSPVFACWLTNVFRPFSQISQIDKILKKVNVGIIVQLPKDLMDWVREDFATRLATQTSLCLGPRFILSSEGLALGEMEFEHILLLCYYQGLIHFHIFHKIYCTLLTCSVSILFCWMSVILHCMGQVVTLF